MARSDDAFSRVDVVSSLRRCLNQRLQHLQGTYHFDTIPFPSPRKGRLAQLESLGVVRPLLIQHLMKVRNHVEHNDGAPPSRRQCQQFIDVIWYFLRTTDAIARNCVTSFFYEYPKGGDSYGVWLNVEPTALWRLTVSGWLLPNLLSVRRHPKRIELACSRVAVLRDTTIDRYVRRQKGTIAFDGVVTGPREFVCRVISQYFRLR